MTETDTKQAALDFIRENSIGVLSTIAPDGSPRSRTVYYASDNSFDIYFLTVSGTRKVEDINHDHRAAFVITDADAPKTMQIEGVTSEQPDATLMEPAVKSLMDTLMERGSRFAPVTRLDAGTVLFYKLTPTWVRFGDFTMGESTDEVLSVITDA